MSGYDGQIGVLFMDLEYRLCDIETKINQILRMLEEQERIGNEKEKCNCNICDDQGDII